MHSMSESQCKWHVEHFANRKAEYMESYEIGTDECKSTKLHQIRESIGGIHALTHFSFIVRRRRKKTTTRLVYALLDWQHQTNRSLHICSTHIICGRSICYTDRLHSACALATHSTARVPHPYDASKFPLLYVRVFQNAMPSKINHLQPKPHRCVR